MLFPILLYTVFSLLAALGAFLIGRQQSPRRGVAYSVWTLAFFVALGAGLLALLRSVPHV
ncbi:MAG TPA: hypothetical protein VN783_01485 [Thermoanaerobaculia bacterium]|nr:hypothetical protein [Thermoanaerobaculia bacterium]